jgi:predicted alpha/beta hydrolase
MKIETLTMKSDGIDIPSIKITASDDAPDVVVLHGYGGSKEEQLGLSWRISMLGFNTLTVDLRGHGENILPLSIKIQDDLDGLIRTIKRPSRPVVAIGHSLGGRIALLSNAEYRIGLSPALPSSFSEQTQATITMLRQYRVRKNILQYCSIYLKNSRSSMPALEPMTPLSTVRAMFRKLSNTAESCRELFGMLWKLKMHGTAIYSF